MHREFRHRGPNHRRVFTSLSNARVRSPGPRPVMSKDQLMDLCRSVLKMTSVENVTVSVEHAARSTVILSRNQVHTSNDGDDFSINVSFEYNHAFEGFSTNETNPDVLRGLVKQSEALMLDRLGVDQHVDTAKNSQDTYVPVDLWHDSTIEAMQTVRQALVPQLVQPIAKQGLTASGFLGFLAKACVTMTKAPTEAYYEETDCDLSMTAQTQDHTSSGWGGQANRRWEAMDAAAVTARAADMALRGVNPKAVEPGYYTTILTRDAIAQIMRYFAYFYDGGWTEDAGATPMWKQASPPNRIGERIFDRRVNMSSDPGDPEGGFSPFFFEGSTDDYANPKIDWVKDGVLKHLALGVGPAVARSLPYSEDPSGLRISGGETSIEEMIKSCTLGIFVNHFGSVDLGRSKQIRRDGVLTGVTRDGCFLIKDGKIDKPVKNFRFTDSPMVMLNNIIALGESHRAAYGFTAPNWFEPQDALEWPRRPIIVPPMMIRDFNFTSLADAV